VVKNRTRLPFQTNSAVDSVTSGRLSPFSPPTGRDPTRRFNTGKILRKQKGLDIYRTHGPNHRETGAPVLLDRPDILFLFLGKRKPDASENRLNRLGNETWQPFWKDAAVAIFIEQGRLTFDKADRQTLHVAGSRKQDYLEGWIPRDLDLSEERFQMIGNVQGVITEENSFKAGSYYRHAV
jgi:hypothetical protein